MFHFQKAEIREQNTVNHEIHICNQVDFVKSHLDTRRLRAEFCHSQFRNDSVYLQVNKLQ